MPADNSDLLVWESSGAEIWIIQYLCRKVVIRERNAATMMGDCTARNRGSRWFDGADNGCYDA